MKKIPHAHIVGEKGINLIQKIVLEMGFLWNPSSRFDAGIDGTIEIRDQETGEAKNLILQVQSKATEANFPSETREEFSYYCSEADLEYWLNGNIPVLLICSRPRTAEAYFISVKDYFQDHVKRKSKAIRFNKKHNAFDLDARDSLLSLAASRLPGSYVGPLPKNEKISTNLLELKAFPSKIYVARSKYPSITDIFQIGRTARINSGWYFKYGSIISFHDLGKTPWNQICEEPYEMHPTHDWSDSIDNERMKDFVRLLNQTLKEQLWQSYVRHHPEKQCFYFSPTPDLRPRVYKYQGSMKGTSRTVFAPYLSRDGRRILFYRHSAFEAQFQKYDNKWVLQILPTYLFTYDGYKNDRYSGEHLKKIKEKERNQAVLGQVIMWASLLATGTDLFAQNQYFLQFGDLIKFINRTGINDEHWLKKESIASPESLI